MSKFLSLTVSLLSYNATQQSNDPADAIKIKSTIEESNTSNISRSELSLASGAGDQSITLPANTCTYLLIFSDQPLSMKLNGGSSVGLTPIASGTKSPVFFQRGSITSLTLNNSSGVVANIDVIAASL